jgi:hypothetical protein
MKDKLIDKVDDGFNYFNSGFLEELTTDKKYYVKVFMEYIEYLEKRTLELQKDLGFDTSKKNK